jgi:CDP-diacylglycerol---glycerol-3-phosphate 3-phosphatidyltransferase
MTPRAGPLMTFLALAGVIAIGSVAIGLPAHDPTAASWAFVVGALPTWLYLVACLTRLRRERPTSEDGGRTALTWATWVTIGRGFLVSVVAGFALEPAPAGRARWIPGVLYALAALADRADGALARWTKTTTALGAKLDVTTDVVGLLVAPIVGARWACLPPWYLVLALAYPTFRFSLVLRRARGLPVHLERLRLDPRARFFAGVQMTVVAVALLGVLPRALTWMVASVAMVPTLALFMGEWWLVTRSATDGDARAERLHA